MKMRTAYAGETEGGKSVPVGTEVEYLGHVPGGMVRVRRDDGSEEIMHPHCFAELRPEPAPGVDAFTDDGRFVSGTGYGGEQL